MKMKLMIIMTAGAMVLMSGCASMNGSVKPTQVKADVNSTSSDMQKIKSFVDADKTDVAKELLKSSPSFAQKHRQDAVEANMVSVKNKMPLYRQPLFAQMVVFPYVSDSGIYHGYQESWVKIKNGEWILAHPASNTQNERIFFPNGAR